MDQKFVIKQNYFYCVAAFLYVLGLKPLLIFTYFLFLYNFKYGKRVCVTFLHFHDWKYVRRYIGTRGGNHDERKSWLSSLKKLTYFCIDVLRILMLNKLCRTSMQVNNSSTRTSPDVLSSWK